MQAAAALSARQSSQAWLTTQLLLQVSLCEAEEELYAGALNSVSKALAVECSEAHESVNLKTETLQQQGSGGQAASAVVKDAGLGRGVVRECLTHPLDRTLLRLRQRLAPALLSPDHCTPLDALQMLALRLSHERNFSRVVSRTHELKRLVLAEVASEAKRLGAGGLLRETLPASVSKSSSAKQATADKPSLPQGKHSQGSSKTNTAAASGSGGAEQLPWPCQESLKRLASLIAEVGSRGVSLKQTEAAIGLFSSALSLIQGTEECVGTQDPEVTAALASLPGGGRVGFHPMLDAETAVEIAEAAFALVSCCRLLSQSACKRRQSVRVVKVDADSSLPTAFSGRRAVFTDFKLSDAFRRRGTPLARERLSRRRRMTRLLERKSLPSCRESQTATPVQPPLELLRRRPRAKAIPSAAAEPPSQAAPSSLFSLEFGSGRSRFSSPERGMKKALSDVVDLRPCRGGCKVRVSF